MSERNCYTKRQIPLEEVAVQGKEAKASALNILQKSSRFNPSRAPGHARKAQDKVVHVAFTPIPGQWAMVVVWMLPLALGVLGA